MHVEELAKKLAIKPERVRHWERTGELSGSQAERLAKATHTPLGYLYLDAPPDEQLPIPDFRTVGGAEVARPSPDLLDVLDDALRRQDWFRDYLISSGETALAFVGSVDLDDQPETTAATIRAAIRLETQQRSAARTWEDALRLQVERIEDSGVLIMRSGIVGNNTHRPLSVEEFRGFALSDRYAPLVFINGRDSKGAQMFTLAHELVHIWLGMSGVSNLKQTYAPARRAERFCNRVAAEMLVPKAELRAQWRAVRDLPTALAGLTRHFKVSSLVLLRRLHDIDILSDDEFQRRYREEEERFRETEAQTSGGGDFYRTEKTRTGTRFARALIESTLEGRTPYREAFQLLGIRKVGTFHEFARAMDFAV